MQISISGSYKKQKDFKQMRFAPTPTMEKGTYQSRGMGLEEEHLSVRGPLCPRVWPHPLAAAVCISVKFGLKGSMVF